MDIYYHQRVLYPKTQLTLEQKKCFERKFPFSEAGSDYCNISTFYGYISFKDMAKIFSMLLLDINNPRYEFVIRWRFSMELTNQATTSTPFLNPQLLVWGQLWIMGLHY